MKVFQAVAFSGLMATFAAAFSNTGPVYASINQNNGQDQREFQLSRYMDSDSLNAKLSTLQNPTEVFQVSKELLDEVSKEAVFQQFKQKVAAASVSDKVRYDVNKAEENEITGFKQVSAEQFGKQTTATANGDNVIIKGFQSSSEFISLLQKTINDDKYSSTNIVVQFVPANDSDSQSSIKGEPLQNARRDLSSEQIEQDSAKLVDEINDTFDKLVAEAELEGGYMTIQDHESSDNNNTAADSVNANANADGFEEIKVSNGSLFETYQFFSSGILSATIVSLFLVYVLIQGLSWVASLQVSYRALERPVDGNKKNKWSS